MPPCVANSTYAAAPIACEDDTACNANALSFSATAYLDAGWNSQKPIGLIKDGHILWGPYDSTGNLWTGCEIDVCNGLKLDGYYGYVSSMFHPYFWGCFGPGNQPSYNQSCSSNPRTCSSFAANLQS